MKISNKYNIPQETIDRMVKDGFISCSWPRYEKIFEQFEEQMRKPGAVRSHVIQAISDKEHISERHIRDIIAKFK